MLKTWRIVGQAQLRKRVNSLSTNVTWCGPVQPASQPLLRHNGLQ